MHEQLIARLLRYSEKCIAERLDADFAAAVGEAVKALGEARPVVLCRGCKYWEYDVIFADGWCRGKHQGNPNWFCADGEKREGS